MSVRHITTNSRDVKKDSIFIALIGNTFDGHNFIEDAILRGATCVYYSKALPFLSCKYPSVEFVFDKNLKQNLPQILKSFYTLPSHIVAITGTNGKTSTAFLTMQALGKLGIKAGFIGTIGVFCYTDKMQNLFESELTTPDLCSFYYFLAVLKSKDINHVIFEASSIGISQKRLEGVNVEVACFTNFTQDHLDFHHTMENYFHTKSLLFSEVLSKNGVAIFDTSKFPQIVDICKRRDVKILPIEGPQNISLAETTCEFCVNDTTFKLNFGGKFQIENMLFVIKICSYFGFSLNEISKISSTLIVPKGRFECVNQKPYIFIDYAHTPDSLLKALETIKKSSKGRVIAVFGCGGDRDNSKRKIMGEVGCKMADFCIITDDNPRTESPSLIRKEIISGFTNDNFKEVEDRKEAIKTAISLANPEDAILIAGKGHEEYQIIGTKKFKFSDLECVKEIYKK